nr:MAG TPA: hypothetical protein [Caudoviricetes sp.]
MIFFHNLFVVLNNFYIFAKKLNVNRVQRYEK